MNCAQMFLRSAMACVATLLLLGAPLTGCSDDTTDNNEQTNNGMSGNNGAQCPAGERYNPILGKCVEDEASNNGSTNNTSANNTSTNNTSANNTSANNTSANNTSANNGAMNNTSTNNTSTNNTSANNTSTNNTSANNTSANNTMADPDMGMDPDMGGEVCGFGTIKGRACAPSGDILAAATITVEGVDCHNNMPFTMSVTAGGDGTYSLSNIPSGLHTVTIASGSFNRSFQVLVRDGEETDLTRQASKYCLEATSVKIAVISGSYDDVEGILDDLQLEYTVVGTDGGTRDFFGGASDSAGLQQARSFLLDPAVMSQYDIIFINCGNLWDFLNSEYSSDVTTVVNNLRTYYQNGGSIYASDWAHMFIEQPFPNVLDFFPAGAGNDSDVQNARQGYAPQTILADVESMELQSLLGATTLSIDFPHNPPQIFNDHWVMVAGADAATVVHLRGDAQQCATQQCSSAGATLTGAPLLVTYKNPVSGGSMAFTSFHNHAEGTPISPDISKTLKFLIFQL